MPSTKDAAHIRCSKGKIGNMIPFSNNMTLDMKKEVFLANPRNKQNFIYILREKNLKMVSTPFRQRVMQTCQ